MLENLVLFPEYIEILEKLARGIISLLMRMGIGVSLKLKKKMFTTCVRSVSDLWLWGMKNECGRIDKVEKNGNKTDSEEEWRIPWKEKVMNCGILCQLGKCWKHIWKEIDEGKAQGQEKMWNIEKKGLNWNDPFKANSYFSCENGFKMFEFMSVQKIENLGLSLKVTRKYPGIQNILFLFKTADCNFGSINQYILLLFLMIIYDLREIWSLCQADQQTL